MKTEIALTTQSPIDHLQSGVRKIAIFRALYLGDLLCAVPAFRALRRRFPAAEITLIGLPWAGALVDRLPYIDCLAIFPGYPGIAEVEQQAGRTAAFLAEARAQRYDLAVQMHGDGSISNGFVADLGARVSLGYRRGRDERLSISRPYRPGEHEVRRWLRLVQIGCGAALAPPDGRPATSLEFPLTPAEEAHAAALLACAADHSGPLIGLHAGAKVAARRWPPARFAALADALVERYGARIVLTGSADERPIIDAVRRAARAPLLDLAGATDLGSFAAVVGALDLLVTNDTGASHLAAATATRSVVLFGPSRPGEWAPLDKERHRVVDALALDGTAPETALRRLPVAPVLAACAAMIERTKDQRRKTKDERRRTTRLS